MKNLDREYWDERYRTGDTPWDVQSPTGPLMNYIDNIPEKESRILFPGAGRAHDAYYAYKSGRVNVFICDWSPRAKSEFTELYSDFPAENFIVGDFFKIQPTFDYVMEQTFFCALEPKDREKYVRHTSRILNAQGIIAGVLFDFDFDHNGPPFGGSKEEYRNLFSPYFKINILETAYNSIDPRAGNELFIEAVKRKH